MSGSMGRDRTKATLPLVNFDDFVVTDLVDETLVYDLRNHRAHCLNRVAGTIWRHCDGKTTVEQVARRIGTEAGVPADAALVLHGLQGLQKSGLVDVPATPKAFGASVSRRDVIKRIGIGSALAIPLVTSIVAPTAVSAQTRPCVPVGTGQPCIVGLDTCCATGTGTNGASCCAATSLCCLPNGSSGCATNAECCSGKCNAQGNCVSSPNQAC